MRKLVTPARWLQSTVTEEEANTFNPSLGPCCEPTHFRVHLGGKTCNNWNKSAILVFTDDFLRVHPEYHSQDGSVRDMVLMKSRATLDSTIRKYRESLVPRTPQELEDTRKRKNRQERKRKVKSAHPTIPPRR